MNDTRRRPATVAVAVCIGSYARVIFVMVLCKAGERARKTPMFQAVRKNTKGKARDFKNEKYIIHDA